MRKILIIFLCSIAVLVGGYAAYRGYKVWKQSHMISLARGFIAKSDVKNALLSLQQALRSNPQNVEATRLMAELSEAGRSPGALLWRSRVVGLNPKSVDDRFALARTALVMRDYASATNALDGVSEDGKKTAPYHYLAGMVATTINQPTIAESHFIEAARLEPTNAAVQLNLAVLRLQQTNALVLANARNTLRDLCGNPILRCQALRWLAHDAIRYGQTNEALGFSRELLLDTNSVFSDRILRLELLQMTQNPEFKSALLTFQHEATNHLGKLSDLAMWLITKTGPDGPRQALGWLKSLPMDIQTNQPSAMLIAQCHTSLRDWRGLQTTVSKQNWGELEFIRHAFLASAMRGLELIDTAKTEWQIALKDTQGRKESLVMLLQFADQEKWLNEKEDILWTIVNRYPSEKWAFRALSRNLYDNGRTRPLLVLFGQQLKANPSDLALKNNLAMAALLLDARELKPHDLAREVYEKSPTNSTFASTYAFSLYVQKKNVEALKVIEQLKPQELEAPSTSGYYGMILKANGNGAKAMKYFDLASKASLLPEERKLFEKARGGR